MAYLDVCRFRPTTGGTTDWTVSSAVTGYQTPANAGALDGNVYRYRAQSGDLSQWEIGFGAYTASGTVLARTTVLFNSLGTTAKINFTAVPQVAIVALGEDLRQKLSATQTYYVRTDGSDSNSGLVNTAGGAWLTWQHAVDHIANNVDCAGQAIQVLAGQKTGAFTAGFTISGPFVGDAGNVSFVGSPPVAITGATNATPIVITATGHDYANGDHVVISGVLGNLAANGAFIVASANIGAGTFALTKEIDSSNVAGTGAYTSGGTVQAPSRVTIATAGAAGTSTASPIKVLTGGVARVNGFKFSSTNYILVDAEDDGVIILGKNQYDAPGTGVQQLWATRGARISIVDSYSISGSGGASGGQFMQASHHGNIRQDTATGYAIANLTYDASNIGFLYVDNGEIITTNSPSAAPFSANGFTVTGRKWEVEYSGGALQVEGNSPPHDSDILGSTTGYNHLRPVIVTISKNIADASTSTGYTGTGFKPSSLIVTGGINGGAAFVCYCGMASRVGNTAGNSSILTTGVGALVNSNLIAVFDNAATNGQTAVVSSYDNDGFTLSWTKAGTPTGTATFYVMCFP